MGFNSYIDDDENALDIPALAALLDKLDKLGSQPGGERFLKMSQTLVQDLGPEDMEKLLSYVNEQEWRSETLP